MSGFICSSNQYFFDGWYFEYHKFCGPWPLNKNGDQKKRAGKKFWMVWDKFSRLSETEREKFIVHNGGCQRF